MAHWTSMAAIALVLASCRDAPTAARPPLYRVTLPTRAFTDGAADSMALAFADALALRGRTADADAIRALIGSRAAPSPVVANDEDPPPDAYATIFNAQSAVYVGANAVPMALTDYRGGRASHDFDIEVTDATGQVTIPSSSVHLEGIGSATGGVFSWEFFSSVQVGLPRDCGMTVSISVVHRAWWPNLPWLGEDAAVSNDSNSSDACAPPPDCGGGGGGGGGDPPPDQIVMGGSGGGVLRLGTTAVANDCGGGCGGGSGGGSGGCSTQWGEIDISYDGGATWSVFWEGYYTVCES